jgi:hypothetical protein
LCGGLVLSGRPVPLLFGSGARDENHATMNGKIEAKTMANQAFQLFN